MSGIPGAARQKSTQVSGRHSQPWSWEEELTGDLPGEEHK